MLAIAFKYDFFSIQRSYYTIPFNVQVGSYVHTTCCGFPLIIEQWIPTQTNTATRHIAVGYGLGLH